MNTSILVKSFRYISVNYNLLAALSFWIYQELTSSSYFCIDKLMNSFKRVDISIFEFLLLSNLDNIPKDTLNDLLIRTTYFDSDDDTTVPMTSEDRAKIVKMLIGTDSTKHRADVHVNNNKPLRSACASERTEVVKILLEHGADIHVDFDRIIEDACYNEHIPLVELLIEFGADINTVNSTCLKVALWHDNIELIKILLKANIIVPIELVRYCYEKKSVEIIRMITEYTQKNNYDSRDERSDFNVRCYD